MSDLALDRQDIEKKDFPISRRGYEPEAVDQHLARLAGEVERLERELADGRRSAPLTAGASAPAPAPAPSLALAASDRVRSIIEAAESSADEIVRGAEVEAEQTRASALSRSEEHVGSVGAATGAMRDRIDAMERELAALVDGLRTGTQQLTGDLSELQGSLGAVYGAAGLAAPAAPVAPAAPEPVVAAVPEIVEAHDEPVDLADDDEDDDDDDPEPEFERIDVEEALGNGAPRGRRFTPASERGDAAGDVEGARLIALNMALNGQSRDETDAYLRETFKLTDRDGLLDEVYATVGG